jgi:hypothetical protein
MLLGVIEKQCKIHHHIQSCSSYCLSAEITLSTNKIIKYCGGKLAFTIAVSKINKKFARFSSSPKCSTKESNNTKLSTILMGKLPKIHHHEWLPQEYLAHA